MSISSYESGEVYSVHRWALSSLEAPEVIVVLLQVVYHPKYHISLPLSESDWNMTCSGKLSEVCANDFGIVAWGF